MQASAYSNKNNLGEITSQDKIGDDTGTGKDMMTTPDKFSGWMDRDAANKLYKEQGNLDRPEPYYSSSEAQQEKLDELAHDEQKEQFQNAAEKISDKARQEADERGGTPMEKEEARQTEELQSKEQLAEQQRLQEEQQRKEYLQDWGKAIGMDAANGVMGLGAGLVQGADKALGTLVSMTKQLMSGHPTGVGTAIANSIVDGGMALKPVKDSLARSLGINERNGTIDPEAAGTLRGAQYYQGQRRIAEYNSNMDKWLKDSLGPQADMNNILETLDAMDTEGRADFIVKFNTLVNKEKNRLYAKAREGKLDAVDKAMIASYGKVADGIRQTSTWAGRELHNEAAQMGTMATLGRNYLNQRRIDHDIKLREMTEEVNDPSYPDSRNRALFNAMKNKMRTPEAMAGLIIPATDESSWRVDQSKLEREDWAKIRHALESKQQKNRAGIKDIHSNVSPPLDDNETELLDQMRLFLNTIQQERGDQRERDKDVLAQNRLKEDVERNQTGAPEGARSLRDQALINGWAHRSSTRWNSVKVPTDRKLRDEWVGSIDKTIDGIRQRKNMPITRETKLQNNGIGDEQWFDYLVNGMEDTSDEDYWNAVMAQNTFVAIKMSNMAEPLLRSDEAETTELADKRRRLRNAMEKVMDGRTVSAADELMPYRAGYDGEAEQEFIDAYNDLNNAIADARVDQNLNGVVTNISDPNKFGQMMDTKENGIRSRYYGDFPMLTDDPNEGVSPRSIFGPKVDVTNTGPTPQEVKDILKDMANYGNNVLGATAPITQSATIDAEGLTYGELYPIVKSKLGLSDEDTDRFIKAKMTNVGKIDSKDDLKKEMDSAASTPQYAGMPGKELTEEQLNYYSFGRGQRGQRTGTANVPPYEEPEPKKIWTKPPKDKGRPAAPAQTADRETDIRDYLDNIGLDYDKYGGTAALLGRNLLKDPTSLYLYSDRAKNPGERMNSRDMNDTYTRQHNAYESLHYANRDNPYEREQLEDIWRHYFGTALAMYNTGSRGLFLDDDLYPNLTGEFDNVLGKVANDEDKKKLTSEFGDIARELLEGYKTGEFKPVTPQGYDSLAATTRGINDRLTQHIHRMEYDVTRRGRWNEVEGALKDMRFDTGALSNLSGDDLKNTVEQFATRNCTYADVDANAKKVGKILNDLEDNDNYSWNEDWMSSDKRYLHSKETYDALKDRCRMIKFGLDAARMNLTQKGENKIPKNIFNNKKPLPSMEWYAGTSKGSVDNLGQEKTYEDTFTEKKLRPLFDRYQQAMRGRTIAAREEGVNGLWNEVSQFTDEDLLEFHRWLKIMDDKLRCYGEFNKDPEGYKEKLRTKNSQGKGKESRVYYDVDRLPEIGRFIVPHVDMIGMFRSIVGKMVAKRGLED